MSIFAKKNKNEPHELEKLVESCKVTKSIERSFLIIELIVSPTVCVALILYIILDLPKFHIEAILGLLLSFTWFMYSIRYYKYCRKQYKDYKLLFEKKGNIIVYGDVHEKDESGFFVLPQNVIDDWKYWFNDIFLMSFLMVVFDSFFVTLLCFDHFAWYMIALFVVFVLIFFLWYINNWMFLIKSFKDFKEAKKQLEKK